MKIDVTDILNGRVGSISVDCSEGIPEEGEYSEMLPYGVSIPAEGITVSGKITDTGGCMSLDAEVTVRYSAPCDRCLEDTEYSFSFDLYRVVSASASPEARERDISEDEKAWDGVTDDLIYVSDGKIDLTSDLMEAISLEFPMRHLCSEDCRGLCPVCGEKISDEHPGCEAKKEIDPRLAILKKLLENSEEV